MYNFEIEGQLTNPQQLDSIKEYLNDMGIQFTAEFQEDFSCWVVTLPTEPVTGFREAANDWIRQWGNHGGDLSTEVLISQSGFSDIPRQWATDAYKAVVYDTTSPIEATALLKTLVGELLSSLQTTVKE